MNEINLSGTALSIIKTIQSSGSPLRPRELQKLCREKAGIPVATFYRHWQQVKTVQGIIRDKNNRFSTSEDFQLPEQLTPKAPLKQKKAATIPKYESDIVASTMPPLDYRHPLKPNDFSKSPAANWLLEQPAIKANLHHLIMRAFSKYTIYENGKIKGINYGK